jgi:hypothetical protein
LGFRFSALAAISHDDTLITSLCPFGHVNEKKPPL